jgi:S1-C subfamily serine protease
MMKAIVQHLMTLVAGIVITLLIAPQLGSAGENYVPPAQIAPVVSLQDQERLFAQVYDTVAPSVVAINLAVRPAGELLYTPISSGSGFILNTQGHIVTNSHVIQLTEEMTQGINTEDGLESRVEIRMYDGTIAAAEIVGADADSDIAVLRVNVDAQRLRPIGFADSTLLRVGQVVLALGNPFSNDWTMTTGIVSALNRSLVGLDGFSIGGVIQTDAAINPGNSGGPLVNLQGQVIGVNSQINTASGSNSGVGFAIPSNLVNKVAQSIIQNGAVAYSFIGIQSRPVDLNLIETFGLPNNLRGVAVWRVFENSPAAQAGLRSLTDTGVDVITSINGRPVADFDELIGYLAINTNPGDSVIISVFRDGTIVDIQLTLTNRPE